MIWRQSFDKYFWSYFRFCKSHTYKIYLVGKPAFTDLTLRGMIASLPIGHVTILYRFILNYHFVTSKHYRIVGQQVMITSPLWDHIRSKDLLPISCFASYDFRDFFFKGKVYPYNNSKSHNTRTSMTVIQKVIK